MLGESGEGEEDEEETGEGELEDVLITNTDLIKPTGVTVEPILFSVFFSVSLTGSVITNFMELKICEQQLNHEKFNCSEPFSQELEAAVQPVAARILMYCSLVMSVLPSLLSFFIGPWSDSNGRKPFMVIPLAGYTCFYMTWGVLSTIPSIPVHYYILPSSLVAISGGTVAIFTCVNSYIGDVSTTENRAFRFTVLTGSFMAGTVVGSLASVELFKQLGPARYCGILFIASFMCFLALVYTLFFVKETINLRQCERQVFFNWDHIRSMISVVSEARPGCGRAIIILMAFILLFMVTAYEGEFSVKYLSLKEALAWRLEEYNLFCAGSTLFCVVVSMLGITLMRKVFRMHNLVICLLTVVLWLISSILVPFSKSGLQYIIFASLGSLSPLIGPTLRSEMSRIVPHSDLGKVFAFDSAVESLQSYIASPLYTLVYSYVLTKMPLSVFFVSTGFISIILFINLLILGMERYCGKPYYTLVHTTHHGQPTTSQSVVS